MWLFKGQIRDMKNLSKIPETGKQAKGLGTLRYIIFFKNCLPWWTVLLFHTKRLLEINVYCISSLEK